MVSGARFGTGNGEDWGGEGLESGEGGLAGNGEEREEDVGSGGGGEPEWLVCARDLVIKGAIAARAQDSEAQASKGMGNDGNASDKDRRPGRKDDVRAHTATYRGGSRGDLAVVAGDESETTWSLSGIRSLFRGSLGYQQDRTRPNFLRRNTTVTITIVTTIITLLHSFRSRGVLPLRTGADASGAVGLVLGGISFTQVELFRRSLAEVLGESAAVVYELPIVLLATLFAVSFTCAVVCPLETARVKLMSSDADDSEVPGTLVEVLSQVRPGDHGV